MSRFLDETRERFLLAIAAKLPPERFIELHFFQPIRQGGVESGVAVVAAHPERPPEPPILADAPPSEEEENAPAADRSSDRDEGSARDDTRSCGNAASIGEPSSSEAGSASRYTVYTAKYRLVLKGIERGTWDCTVVAEADAPLVTVETVVRGVQRRAGDADGAERMSGEEAQRLLAPKLSASAKG